MKIKSLLFSIFYFLSFLVLCYGVFINNYRIMFISTFTLFLFLLIDFIIKEFKLYGLFYLKLCIFVFLFCSEILGEALALYSSVSYWDKDKKQPRSKRKYLGKVDPETGEIIPSRGRTVHSEEKASEETTILPALYKEIEERDRTIKELRRDLDEVTEKYNQLLTTVQKIRAMVELY